MPVWQGAIAQIQTVQYDAARRQFFIVLNRMHRFARGLIWGALAVLLLWVSSGIYKFCVTLEEWKVFLGFIASGCLGSAIAALAAHAVWRYLIQGDATVYFPALIVLLPVFCGALIGLGLYRSAESYAC